MPDTGLTNRELLAVTEVLNKRPGIRRAVIFGSRAKGSHKPFSDVDIAVYGNIGVTEAEDIICELDELPLVYKFDVLAYELIKSPELREHIDRVGAVVYDKTGGGAD